MTVRGWLHRVGAAAFRRTRAVRPPEAVQRPTTEWSRIEPIFTAALGLPAAERGRFLDRECAGNPRLRAEVASLLAAGDRSGIVDHAVDKIVTSEVAPADPASLPTSASPMVSHYELVQRLAGGGMGVIYRARDVKLRRTVALKFLPPALSADERAKARFLLEARAAAALDHRNVCAIHEIGETADGHLFIAMPFYEGETLADRLRRGPLPLAEALPIAIQLAHGLAHAHERGIVHRDIKPANVMLTRDGVPTILDFGIVKHGDQGLTGTGLVVGTLPYMSPEQLRRDAVDARTDIWSLGIVLHEMLAGGRPFAQDDDHSLRDAIVFAQPESLRAVRPDLPHELSRIVSLALAKRPDDRHGSALAFAQALEAVERMAVSAAGGQVAAADPRADRWVNAYDGERQAAQLVPGGERRHATVVLCTMSGSVELVERLPAREVETVIYRFRQEAFEIVERHGGTVNEFSEDRIVLLFGVPVGHEDHCARAVRAALELRTLVGRWRQTQPAARALALHIAIDTGDAAVQRVDGALVPYRIAGRPAARAAQLCAHAATDEILISPDGARAVSPLFELGTAPAVVLPGEPLALVPLRVLRETTTANRLELLAQSARLTTFTGRDLDLAALAAALDEAGAGRGGVVAVTGEPGVGKSRLLLEFRRAIPAATATVLVGGCSSYGQATAYMPWLDVVWQVLGVEPGARATATDADVVARLANLDPSLEPFAPLYLHLLSIRTETHRLPDAVHEERRRLALREALAGLLVAVARRQLCVLLLEDWHWVDPESDAVLAEAATLAPNHQLLIVLTSRSGYALASSPRGAVVPIVLRPLGTSSAAAIVKAILGTEELPDDLVARIHERTGGNPFFLEEMARSLLESGTVAVDRGRARIAESDGALELPPTVQAVIRARIDRLDLAARQVLRAASIVGRDFTRGVVAAAVPESVPVAPALERLEAAGLIQHTAVLPEHCYRFRHALTQEAAYAGLLEHQRAHLHGAIGAAIEAFYGDRADVVDRLAQHYSLAEHWPKAVEYGLRSAERLQGLSLFAESLQALDRTRGWADMLDSDRRLEQLAEIFLRQERICDWLGLRDRQRELIDELITQLGDDGDRDTLAEAYLRKGDLHTTLRQFDAAKEALEVSLSLRRQLGRCEPRTLKSLGFLSWYQGRHDEARSWAEESLRLNRRDADTAAIVGDLSNLAAIHFSARDLDGAERCIEEGLRLSQPAQASVDPKHWQLWLNRINLLHKYTQVLTERGEFDRALECVTAPAEWARQRFMPRVTYFYTAIAQVHLRKGDLATCIEYYRQAIDIARKAHYAAGMAPTLRTLGELLMSQGRDREAVAYLQEAVEVFAKLHDRATEAETCSQLAVTHERLGNHDDAREAWERDRALRHEIGDSRGELAAAEGLGRVARRCLPASVALRYHEEAIELAAAVGDVKTAARLGNAAGIIEWTSGRHVEALAHFEQALARFRDTGDQAGVGLMLNSIAVTLIALGRKAAGRARLEEALAHHRDTGQARLEGHALAALGNWYWENGDGLGAAEWYERSLRARQAIGDVLGEAWMLFRLARSRAAAGDPEAARPLLARAMTLSTQGSDEELMHACAELQAQVVPEASSSDC